MQYSEIHSLKSTGDCIDCLVTFDDLGVLPFTASAVDTSEYGKKIWSDIQAGVWGPIEPETGDKEFLASEIDDLAASILKEWARFGLEYEAREQAAQNFKNANYTGEISPWVSDFAVAAQKTNRDATDTILAQAGALRTAIRELGGLRMRKFEVKAHADYAIAKHITTQILEQMNALNERLKGV